MLLLLMVCMTLVFIGMSWASSLTAVLLFLIGNAALRAMAKADPDMITVYRRHIKYQYQVMPRATAWGQHTIIKNWTK